MIVHKTLGEFRIGTDQGHLTITAGSGTVVVPGVADMPGIGRTHAKGMNAAFINAQVIAECFFLRHPLWPETGGGRIHL